MLKALVSSRVIIASKTFSTKVNVVSKVFKIICNHVENFQNKSYCYSRLKKSLDYTKFSPNRYNNTLSTINARKKTKQFQTLILAHFIQQFCVTFQLKFSQKLLDFYQSLEQSVVFFNICTLDI